MIACARLAERGMLVALAVSWTAAALAQDSLKIRTNYYAVSGGSLRELRAALDRSRPRSATGPHDGLTVWQIGWRVSTHQQGAVSRLSVFTTQTAIHITLPRWLASTNADPELARAWMDYLTALHVHEQGHVQLVRATIAEMHTRVRSVPPGADAHAFRQQIESVANSVLAGGDQRHRDYDARTKHGESQGARLSARPQTARPGPEPAPAGR